jgi:hypothetical protein
MEKHKLIVLICLGWAAGFADQGAGNQRDLEAGFMQPPATAR